MLCHMTEHPIADSHMRFFYRQTATLFLATLLSTLQAPAAPPSPLLVPKTEVRAVWVTTATGLDWPQVAGKERQQESLRRLVRDLHNARFNTIFFQVRPRGDALYRSRYEPWAEILTGTLGKDPGWDPCAFLLAEAHALGMEVHGWFNVFKIRGPNPVSHSTPEHPSHAYADWCVERNGELWLDPGRPEVRTYLLNVALDLIRSYDLDGINFDFIRYPGTNFPDGEAYARYGKGMNRDDWRRNNVTSFVRSFAAEAAKIKPMMKIGSSPYGLHRDDSANRQRGSYYWVYQDSYSWLENKWQDYLSPQVYWQIGRGNGEPDFAQVTRGWSTQTAGRHIYVGIAAYRQEIRSRLGEYIDSCRATGNPGHVFFRWEDIADPRMVAGRYPTWALIPPMHWKDPVPPLAPEQVGVAPTGPRSWYVHWDTPKPAHDGDTAHLYVVYRWTSRFIPFSNPYAIAAILPATQHFFVDSLANGNDGEYFYAITACDRMQNESVPSSVVSSRPVPAIAEVPVATTLQTLPPPRPPSNISLSVSFVNATGRPDAALYSIATRTRVALDVFLKREGAPDTLHTRLVRAVQQEGKYKVRLDSNGFTPGTYLMRLTTTEATIEQSVVVR
jgi:uncharacterized lipoprotein YddW (UPF0748 family)